MSVLVKSIFAFFLISVLVIEVHAQEESPSDKYCGFLASLAEEAIRTESERPGDTNKKLNELMALANIMQKIPPLEKEAIEKRMTFEQFQKSVQEKGLTLSTYYRSMYIGNYMKAVCGEVKTEAHVRIVNGKTVERSQKTTATRQFDPKGHPYYDKMSGAAN